MDLMPVFVVGIITLGIYSLFELFVHRKERLYILDKLDFSKNGKDINLNIFNSKNYIRNNALRIGFLLIGIGLGLLVGFIVYLSNLESINTLLADNQWHRNEIKTTVYCACVLLFGGAGLLTAYLIERKQIKKSE